MKYEPVFGDQLLFEGAPVDAEAVFKSHDGNSRCVYYRLSHGHERYISAEWVGVPAVDSQTLNAMRRVNPEPKRWTVEDQKAGRLPDVGAKVDGGKVVFVNGFNVVTELKSGAVIVSSPKTFLNIFNPIETPEEKAKREEDEFVSLVEFEYNKMPNEISFRAGIRAAYRKLKGGE